MFATRTRLPRSPKAACRLNAEVLEDRYVLSAFGLTPTLHEVVSAPPLAAVLETAARSAPEVHVSVGVSAEAAPLQQEPALLGDLLGLFKQDNASPPAGAPVGSDVAAISAPAPTLHVELGIAGIQVGVPAEASATTISPSVPGLNAAVSVGGNDKILAAVGTSAAGPNIDVILSGSAGARAGGNGKQITVAIGASAENGPNAAPPIEASVVPIVPVVPVVVPFAVQAIPNAVFAEPGRDVGQPAAGNLQNAVALAGPVEILLAGTGDSPAPLPPNIRDTETGIERETLAPQSSGLLTDAIPIDLAALENALQQFLDQFDDLKHGVGDWLRNAGPTPWVFMSLTVAVVAGEIVRRRLQQAQAKEFVTETARREALDWFPAFKNLKEAS